MPVELVINLAADGLVLCFIHTYPFLQVFDRDATARARSIDTCGDDNLSIADVHTLFHRLHQTIPPSSRVERVFQLLANGPRRQLLMSWPSDQFQEAAANEFAKLASSTQLGNATDSSSTTPRGTTSCTKRYKSLGFVSLGDGAGLKNVESVFIPHGQAIYYPSPTSPLIGFFSQDLLSLLVTRSIRPHRLYYQIRLSQLLMNTSRRRITSPILTREYHHLHTIIHILDTTRNISPHLLDTIMALGTKVLHTNLIMAPGRHTRTLFILHLDLSAIMTPHHLLTNHMIKRAKWHCQPAFDRDGRLDTSRTWMTSQRILQRIHFLTLHPLSEDVLVPRLCAIVPVMG
jgi:hypothetical protein